MMKKIILKLANKATIVSFGLISLVLIALGAGLLLIAETSFAYVIPGYVDRMLLIILWIVYEIYVILLDLSKIPHPENMKLLNMLMCSPNFIFFPIFVIWTFTIGRLTNAIFDLLIILIVFCPIALKLSKYFKTK